ncbi:MAG: hypothetical protein EBV34_16595 [Betaproteobacteria bacterium]|jgi:hypothetical protein|nr:hypothetical protein [Betaproteobacteria bacterium]
MRSIGRFHPGLRVRLKLTHRWLRFESPEALVAGRAATSHTTHHAMRHLVVDLRGLQTEVSCTGAILLT